MKGLGLRTQSWRIFYFYNKFWRFSICWFLFIESVELVFCIHDFIFFVFVLNFLDYQSDRRRSRTRNSILQRNLHRFLHHQIHDRRYPCAVLANYDWHQRSRLLWTYNFQIRWRWCCGFPSHPWCCVRILKIKNIMANDVELIESDHFKTFSIWFWPLLDRKPWNRNFAIWIFLDF